MYMLKKILILYITLNKTSDRYEHFMHLSVWYDLK